MIPRKNLESFLGNIGIKSPEKEVEKILQSNFVSGKHLNITISFFVLGRSTYKESVQGLCSNKCGFFFEQISTDICLYYCKHLEKEPFLLYILFCSYENAFNKKVEILRGVGFWVSVPEIGLDLVTNE